MKHYRELSHKSMHTKLSRYGVAGHTKDNPHPTKHVNSLVGGEGPHEGVHELSGGIHGRKMYKRGGAVKRAAGGSVEDPVADNEATERLDTINNRLARGGVAKKDCYASGGAVKSKGKKGTTVNVVIAQPSGGNAPAPAAAAPMPPPPAPPPAMPPPAPPMGGAGGLPPAAMAAMAGGAHPPMPMRASGGRVHMTAGAISGEGRLEKERAAAKVSKKGGM